MSRVTKISMVALTVMMFMAGSAFAQTANQRVEGMTGVGYFNAAGGSDADIVGVRYWMNDGMAIDFGVGVRFQNNQTDPQDTATAPETTSLFDYAFDLGIPWVMHGEENMIVYFRPGVTIAGVQGFDTSSVDDAGAPVVGDKGYDINFRGELAIGGEFFLGQMGWPNLSFSGQIGLGIDVMSFKESGADSDVSFSTVARDVSITESGQLGFHIYF